MNSVECLVIGGGPAGLTAALYLGRFRRRVLLVDGGASRASWIPKTHNLIGYTGGISGRDLLARMREQALQYGAQLMHSEVAALDIAGDGRFVAAIGGERIAADRVLLATGGLDVEPELPGIREAVQEGLVRYCPICDAFEASGKRVGLISYGKCRVREAQLLRAYTAELSVMTLGREMTISDADAATLEDAGVRVIVDPVTRFSRQHDCVTAWDADSNAVAEFDILYSALGTRIRSRLAVALGAETDKDGALVTDRHQRTSVAGMFAAGDVVSGLSQISIAAAQAAVAATAINAELPLSYY
jgi:thioredoxin reductase (NADPH)